MHDTYYGFKILDTNTGLYSIVLYDNHQEAMDDYSFVKSFDYLYDISEILDLINYIDLISDIPIQSITKYDNSTYRINKNEFYNVKFVSNYPVYTRIYQYI